MCNEDLEFSISQYVDGTLSAAERAILERRLSEDAEARALLGEYRELNAVLKSTPLSEIRWDALTQAISHAVDEAEKARSARYRMPSWVRSVALPLALAASVLIVIGVGMHVMHSNSSNPRLAEIVKPQPAPTLMAESIMKIEVGPRQDVASGPAEISVAVGPGEAVKDEPMLAHYSDDVTFRPSHVTIAAGVIPTRDTLSRNAFEMQ